MYFSELFLSPEDSEKLHDFEEECIEDFFREKESKFHNSSEERIRVINERYFISPREKQQITECNMLIWEHISRDIYIVVIMGAYIKGYLHYCDHGSIYQGIFTLL